MKPTPFTCELEVVKSYEDEKGAFHITGYIATSDFDLQGDIISKEALKESSDDLLNKTMLFNHDDEAPIGTVKKQSLDKKGMLVDAIIDQDSTVPKTGMKIVDGIKQNILNRFSIRAKVLDASKEFVSELGRVANVIKRMLLVECSLVSVPANFEAKALSWYIAKALDEGESMKDEKKDKKDEVNESEGSPEIVKDEEGAEDENKEEGSEDEKKEEEKEEAADETSDEVQKGFPVPDVLKKEWQERCDEKGLTEQSDLDEVNQVWGEFCKDSNYPQNYPYPYPSPMRKAIESIASLCDRLAKNDDEAIKTIAKQIDAIASELVGQQAPYPKPESQSKAAETEEPVKDEQKSSSKNSDKVSDGLMKEIASVKRMLGTTIDKVKSLQETQSKVVRKGLVDNEEEGNEEAPSEEEIEKKLEEMEGNEKALQGKLRELVGRDEGAE